MNKFAAVDEGEWPLDPNGFFAPLKAESRMSDPVYAGSRTDRGTVCLR
jgi:hypothetical protein